MSGVSCDMPKVNTTLQIRMTSELIHGGMRRRRTMGDRSKVEMTVVFDDTSDDVRVRHVSTLRSMSVLCGNRRQRNMHTGFGFEGFFLSIMMGAVVSLGRRNNTWPGLCGPFVMCRTALIFVIAPRQCPAFFASRPEGTGMAETNSNRMATRATRAIGKCIIDCEKPGSALRILIVCQW